MSHARSSELLRQVRTLFGSGVVAGLSDAKLLEIFTEQSTAADEAASVAEAAFSALVARHGPMVLGVCRRALADQRDIEDAFQATFLVLVRRARSVRVGDSLGRWLYGVARRIAAKARARSERSRARFASPAVEPIAPESSVDRINLLAALDEEVSRLPEKYRGPVILCHLEGLSHAEAAARLHWPIGTVSGRLSRARELLKDRLVRRGLAPASGSMVALLVAGEARAAVPARLSATTVRAASGIATGGASQAVAISASAISLLNEVLKTAVVSKLKAAGAVVLAIALAGAAAAAGGSAWVSTQPERGGPVQERQSPAAARPVERQPSAHRPADEIVKELEPLLKTARRSLSEEEWNRTHSKIAALVDELRTNYPDDPRASRFMLDRWSSLNCINRRPEALAETGSVLRTTADPALKRDAFFFETCLTSRDRFDGRSALARAEAFALLAPGDKRAGELFYQAASKLDGDWWVRLGLIVAIALAGVAFVIRRRWWKYAIRLGELTLMLLLVVLCGFKLLASDRLSKIIDALYPQLNDPAMYQRFRPYAVWLLGEPYQQLRSFATSGQAALAVSLAVAAAVGLVVARNRQVKEGKPRMSAARLGILGCVAALVVMLSLDACYLAFRAHAVRERIVREYPDSFRGRMVQGQRRQHERLGDTFNLEFSDAITGKRVSMQDLRGKVVVVDFWATWCGPCVGEIPDMKRLYAKYHDLGVEFIGISEDHPEEDGGLDALKKFVKEQEIPWPQYYQGHDSQRIVSGSPTDDFSESWGISAIPTVFLIDTEGRLYSTEARGQLDTLIPRLLKKSRGSSTPL